MSLNSNPFKENSKAYIFLNICDINYENGFSKIVEYEELHTHKLTTTNGGDWCRSDGGLGKYFNINRNKNKGKITSIQLVGYNKNNFSNKINTNIRQYYKNKKCKFLAIESDFIEIDHKDGRKDQYSLNEEQNINDFQPLHRNVNIAKRSHCKNCKQTNIKFDATELGYSIPQWIGTKQYNGSCVGCYWYDPFEFNKQISQNYKKDK